MMNKNKVLSIVLYSFAGLLAIYAVWSFVHSAGIISEAIRHGQISAGENLYDIISFYMANCAQYFVFALLLTAAGFLIQIKTAKAKSIVNDDSVSTNRNKASDAELDEWFEEVSASENHNSNKD